MDEIKAYLSHDAANRRLLGRPRWNMVQPAYRIRVLPDSPVANFHVAELSFDHRKDVFHLRPHPRLVSVLYPLHLIDAILITIAFVGQVPRQRRGFADRFGLSAIGLIASRLRLFAVQQLGQHHRIGHVLSREKRTQKRCSKSKSTASFCFRY
jgi:hypothetical protein